MKRSGDPVKSKTLKTVNPSKKLRLLDYRTLEDLHRGWFLLKLREHGGNRTKTAKAVGLKVSGVIHHINKFRKRGYKIQNSPLRGGNAERAERHTIKSDVKSNIRKDAKNLTNSPISTFGLAADLERTFFL